MSGRLKAAVANNRGFVGKFAYLLLIAVLLSFIPGPAQDYNYWQNALTGKTKIFTISFSDKNNGIAASTEGKVLMTSDSGTNWSLDNNESVTAENSANVLWTADIYCSVMKTTDGGKTWSPYEDEKQEHFCGVYLKDSNTGYKVASDFLAKVTTEIINYSEMNELESLIDHPKQCTEYYRNAEEGWALGWCVKYYTENKNH